LKRRGPDQSAALDFNCTRDRSQRAAGGVFFASGRAFFSAFAGGVAWRNVFVSACFPDGERTR